MPLVKIILGSTRPNRFGPQPANWIYNLSKEHPEATFELVDLADMNLPLLDEPSPAMSGDYTKDHTKAWAKVIGEADGFVFVTGEYNYAIPAAFKNAVDYLAAEWRYKPVAFVAYGTAAGGTRAVQNFRLSLANLSMFPLRDEVNFSDYWTQLDDKGQLQPNEKQIELAHKLLKNIAFWSEALAPARKKLAS